MGDPESSDVEIGLSLVARVEALLYVSDAPVSAGQLANALQVSSRQVKQALDVLAKDCERRGLRIQRHKNAVQLTTAPEAAIDVENFLNLDRTARLTRAALEVLAIVAYQQPVTRPLIDSIRGVNSDSVLRTLLRHGLIEDVGRSDGPGRPILYTTTSEFLQHFGLSTLHELPRLNPDQVSDVQEMQEEDLAIFGVKEGD
ncbi:MAG: SMC-Scp complex subunit ScpB [Anaerolineales bacterium]|nr:MAG: SMC-Scp complex subunit ScpB [Anaerolineales bacterium]